MGSLTSVREDARLSSESCLPTFAVAENCIENIWDTTAVQVVGRQVRGPAKLTSCLVRTCSTAGGATRPRERDPEFRWAQGSVPGGWHERRAVNTKLKGDKQPSVRNSGGRYSRSRVELLSKWSVGTRALRLPRKLVHDLAGRAETGLSYLALLRVSRFNRV